MQLTLTKSTSEYLKLVLVGPRIDSWASKGQTDKARNLKEVFWRVEENGEKRLLGEKSFHLFWGEGQTFCQVLVPREWGNKGEIHFSILWLAFEFWWKASGGFSWWPFVACILQTLLFVKDIKAHSTRLTWSSYYEGFQSWQAFT